MMLMLLGLVLYELGLIGTAMVICSKVDNNESNAEVALICVATMIWPLYWAARALDFTHVKLLPGPGETT